MGACLAAAGRGRGASGTARRTTRAESALAVLSWDFKAALPAHEARGGQGAREEFELEDRVSEEEEAATRERLEALRGTLDDLPLKYVLKDVALLQAFRVFIKSQHASENLLFYLAVQKFRKHKYVRPNNDLQAILEEAETTLPASDVSVDVTRMHINMARSFRLPMSQVNAIMDALRVYQTFLQDGARMWVCVSPSVLKEVQEILLEKPQLTKQNSVFTKAADEAFQTMERDILPRFVEACMEEELLDRMAYYARMAQNGDQTAKKKASPRKKPMSNRFMPPSVGSSLRRRGEAAAALTFRRPHSTLGRSKLKGDAASGPQGVETESDAPDELAIETSDENTESPSLDESEEAIASARARARAAKKRRGFRHQLRALSSG
ncbi:Regulator of G-protein signaling 21 [Hondaea fermentalgiana]|uniref:Regulator of G-protein signaling 21 n=1 Tax=Hondaea fermentalgiana TaxID=2315210 RepID=A0A2R5GEW7_9STRA|nr:Regulator of G-protein signaling 21 [Hondaea fermentalgiana]|eukprot:GBG28278.1 Regulator of G-protein signaling 21 [Hondaea fermentalgiana]